MKVLEDKVVAANTGAAFTVKKGEHIRIYGRSIVDTVVFNLDNLRERFDQARTKANQGKIYISTGDVLFSKINHVMMTIVEDTYKGTHDLQYGMCSKESYDEFWERCNTEAFKDTLKELGVTKREDLPDHGCYENLSAALEPYNIAPEDIPSPFNIFQSMDLILPEGKLVFRLAKYWPEPGKHDMVGLRAEMNCLVAVSACPSLGIGDSIRCQVYQE